MPELSVRKYAELRGCSHTSVLNAIKDGRLVKAVKRKKGNKIMIDSDLAQFEWEKNTDSTRRFNAKDPNQRHKKAPPAASGEGPPGGGVNEVRTMHEKIKVRMAKLDLDAREGKLISADAVRDEAFRLGRSIRDSLMNIPDRISAQLAGMADPAEIHRRLSEEIRKAIQGLAK